MKISGTLTDIRTQIDEWKKAGETIGLVPTMGALHEGHASLMDAAKKQCDRIVVSIFVNPLQFGPDEDFENYPRNIEQDACLCAEKGVDLVFHPSDQEMYGQNFNTYVVMETLTDTLCGKSRPGHFRGVCTVVSKLFNIINPDYAFFGQKDAQQLAIIKRMTNDLDMRVKIVGCPIIREKDGLAKSSRNAYLTPEERRSALVLSRAIFEADRLIKQGETASEIIADHMREIILSESKASIDYLEIVDIKNLQHIDLIGDSVLIAIAVYIGTTRLIDNVMYEKNE